MTKEELVLWRNSRGYSQQQMATGLQVSQKTYSRWETGERAVPTDLGARLGVEQAAPPEPAMIIPKTHPDLFYKLPWQKKDQHCMAKVHPYWLLPNHPLKAPNGFYPASILDTAEYKTALAAHNTAEAQRRQLEHHAPAGEVGYPDALPNETLAQYRSRHNF
jgi:hypothetical protein